MPRTKLRKDLKLPVPGVAARLNLIRKSAQAVLVKNQKIRDAEKYKLKESLTEYFNMAKLHIKYPNHTFAEYHKAMEDQAAQTKARQRRSRSCGQDDGYSSGSTSSKRRTRSQSRSRATRNNFITPAAKLGATSYGSVTPKMKPNTPQIVLRRPMNGEVAISLGGSPLMVNPVATDSAANVNIPLADGRLLCIQPAKGLRYSQLPHLNEDTALQLKTLQENIQKICEFHEKKKL